MHVRVCTNVHCTINFAVLGVGTKCSAWGCLASALPILREELALQKRPGGAVWGALVCADVCDSASCQHGGVWGSSGGAVGTFYAADVVASCCFYNCGNCGG